MADDVKVKFGGDFTDIAKGAASAVAKAGATIGAWFSDFQKSTAASVANGLALSNILSYVVTKAAQTIELFKGIGDAMSRFGASGAEFGKLAKYGQEVGVSVAQVARATNYFGKVQEQASKGANMYTQSLLDLGFTADEIKNKNVSMTEVLGRLADMYDQTGNQSLVASRATQIFGENSQGLMGIIMGGRKNMEEYVNSIEGVSEAHAKEMEQMARDVDKLKRLWEGLLTIITKVISSLPRRAEEFTTNMVVAAEALQAPFMDNPDQAARDRATTVKSSYGNDKAALKRFADEARENAASSMLPSVAKFYRTFADSLDKQITHLENLEKKNEEKKSANKKTPPLRQEYQAMVVSSLQAIGAGDYTNTLVGNYQQDMLDAAKRTANATEELATKKDSPAAATKPTTLR